MFELNLRKMSQLFMMNPLSFAERPIAIGFFIVTAAVVVLNIRANRRALD